MDWVGRYLFGGVDSGGKCTKEGHSHENVKEDTGS